MMHQESAEDDCIPQSKRIKLDEGVAIDSDSNSIDAEEKKQVGGVCRDDSADKSGSRFTREEDVGISEYVSVNGSRFTGIIKQRYSDFIVNEISSANEIVRLTSLDLPPDPNQESKDCLSSLLSSEEISQLTELSQSKDKSKQIEFKVPDSKETRTKIHVSIRNEYPSLDSRTITGDREDIKLIRVFLRGSRGSNNRSNWPSKVGGDYVKFVLYKENRDTSQTINRLASMLKVKSSVFQYGGTKDKRAITSQHMTAYRITPQRLLSINGANIGIKLGNFEYTKYQMRLGSLSGNHFTIVIRNVQSKGDEGRVLEDDIRASIDSLSTVGFINYFGMQRFGTSVIPTHHIGKALLHSNWQEAIDLILKPREGEPPDMNAARVHYQDTKDVSATLEMIPKTNRNSTEVILLKGLQKYGNNLLASLNCIPRGSRMMYCHGYQSYIWNKLASYRVRTHGLVPILGDIVRKNGNESKEDIDTNPLIDIEFVNESNVDKYSIYDVILPLPGYTVKYPKNDVGEEYAKALSADGLSSEKLLHRVKDFSLSGGYRHLIMKPKDVKWELMRYNDVTLPLTLSDLDVLEGKLPPKSIEDGSRIALKIEFSLPSSTYATMVLREILKTETSSHFQSLLNQQSDDQQSDHGDDEEECAMLN